MAKFGFNPFDKLQFSKDFCFLSGKKLTASDAVIPVFPQWIMDKYQLENQPFKLLDESVQTYGSLQLACSNDAEQAILALETEIETAFFSGYEKVKELDSKRLFQWISKLVYGILHNEIQIGIRQQHAVGEEFSFSQSLQHKFRNLHFMMQSLLTPMEFEERLPWTIKVFRVNNKENTFSYRDEMNTLMFSLRMEDFGIIACLQDNGANAIYHQDILEKIADQELHPIQFEELCARFFYSAYLFNRLPEYTYLPTEEAVYVEAMPLRGISNKPLFDFWQNKTYGQVLENFWKPWSFSLFEIIKNPEKPMSFLLNEDETYTPAQEIALPI